MRFLVLILAVVILLIAAPAWAGESLSGAAAGLWAFDKDDNMASAFVVGLGATYRPDAVDPPPTTPVATGKFTIKPANFIFFTEEFLGKDASLNMTGGGYSLFKADDFEILAEGGVTFRGVGDDRFRVGGMAMVEIGFVSFNQQLRFRGGGGYDGERPLLLLGLGFRTGT